MNDRPSNLFDPIDEMHAFYRQDDPSEEQQFRFVEAMKILIDEAFWEDDIIAFSYNLAMYYRDIKEFELEKKYLEKGLEYDDSLCKEELGIIWYYGLTGEQNFEKAYRCFSEGITPRGQYMIADMYHYGQYVSRDEEKCREILETLFEHAEDERQDERFVTSTLFPEIALRLARLNLEEGTANGYDWNSLLDAKIILTRRQQETPFWGNIKTMRGILETLVEMREYDYGLIDLYDLLTFDKDEAVITFEYKSTPYPLKIFRNEDERIIDFNGKWFHGAEDFLEKARIDGKRITKIIMQINNIQEQKKHTGGLEK